MFSGNPTILGEKVTATSELKGIELTSIQCSLKKTGTVTGNVTFGVWDGSVNSETPLVSFGTLTATSLTTSFADYIKTGSRILQTNDVIGILYNSAGDASNCVVGEYDNADVYDSTNSFKTRYEGGWIDSTAADLKFEFKGYV